MGKNTWRPADSLNINMLQLLLLLLLDSDLGPEDKWTRTGRMMIHLDGFVVDNQDHSRQDAVNYTNLFLETLSISRSSSPDFYYKWRRLTSLVSWCLLGTLS